MTDDKKRVVIKSYLRSQVGEFIRGKDLIFKISGLKDDVALDGFLLKLALFNSSVEIMMRLAPILAAFNFASFNSDA